MLDINFRKRHVKIWNGGLPDCFVYHKRDGSITPVRSTHLPLGVLSNRAFKDHCEYFDLELDDRLFLWSDGIHEARNSAGDMFGEDRLKQAFTKNCNAGKLFDDIIEAVQQFVGSNEKDDDLSLLEIRMAEPEQVDQAFEIATQRFMNAEIAWDMSFEVKPNSFRVFDPLPMMVNVLTEVPSLRSFSSTLYTILAELYANALEHGVLKLDSNLKKSPAGFADYYRLREERIKQVDSGYVRIYISHRTHEQGGTLGVRVVDSGEGFDYHNRQSKEALQSLNYSGRGIALLESLCTSVRYLGCGNTAEVEFSWVSDD
jgi:anti-sigma regulatory factor (Ser/Thr protein kinase)